MAAATKDRDSKVRRSPRRLRGPFPVAASTTIYQGTIVCLDANGRLVAATAALGLHALGIAYEQYDNSSGAAGDIKGLVETGVHKLANDGTATLVDADNGKPCFIHDDQTVGKIAAGDGGGIAGLVEEVQSDGAYVYFGEDFSGYEDPTVEDKENADASPHVGLTRYTVDGTDTSALADGNYIGQIKRLLCVAATSTPDLTVTPTNLQGFTTITLDAVGESITLRWNGTAWQPIAVAGATLA